MRFGVALLDAYLEFLAVRSRPNTVAAVAYDLKVFFTAVGKPPRRVAADTLGFVTAQYAGVPAARLRPPAVLNDDPAARVLIHCHQGRSRSVLLTYAVLRLRGHTHDQATDLIRRHRVQARIVDAYTSSVEQWLAAGANPVGQLRIQ